MNKKPAFVDLTVQKCNYFLTIWSKRSFDLGTDLFACIDIFQDDLFET